MLPNIPIFHNHNNQDIQNIFDKKISYIPYEEIRIEDTNEFNLFRVTSPWLICEFTGKHKYITRIKQFLDKKYHSNLNLQNFLFNFKNHPIAYLSPRKLRKKKSMILTCKITPEFNDSSPIDLISTLFNDKVTKDYILRITLPKNWNWDVNKVTEMCRIPNSGVAYDPYSAYTMLRRYKLIDECNHSSMTDQLFKLLEVTKNNDENRFFDNILLILHQQHYVTKECINSLLPAIHSYIQAQNDVISYINEEKGHDKLVLKSINEIKKGFINEEYYLPLTKMCMKILKFAASHCFLTLCCVVSCFEGNGYKDTDPLAEILKKSSKSASSIGIEQHFRINKKGQHSLIGEKFVKRLIPVDKKTIILATRLTELMTYLQCLLPKTLIDLF